MSMPLGHNVSLNSMKGNPRRQPAHLSVSLRREAAPKTKPITSGVLAQVNSPGRDVKRSSKESSDENETASSANNARKWFDRANKHPKGAFSQILHDEPAYFLPSGSTHGSNLDPQSQREEYLRIDQQSDLDKHPANTNASSADDFRSVIDDLTVENKKLKERLKKLEKTHSPHLEKDRLFEVTIHGLSAKKRRQLEDKLREFTASLDDSGSSDSPRDSGDKGQNGVSPLPEPKRSTGSSESNSRPVDSAYASMSNSAPTSTSNLVPIPSEGRKDKDAKQENAANVQSFLESIPEGLMPRKNLAMSERQKKKLVVQRLEQLFTGRQRVLATNSQSQQQQEVSKLAARADDAAANREAQAEGLREAHMLPTQMEIDPKPSKLSSNDSQGASHNSRDVSDFSGGSPSGDSEIEQRPTRPLDLDPDRAQIPAENVEYFRHLGLSTPQLLSEDSSDAEPDAQGWIYLNLLVNMAQLHIINVTPDFVRHAVEEVSDKFQVSRDGHKLRWRGGLKGTKLSSSESASNASPEDSDDLVGVGIKRRKINGGRFATVPVNVQNNRSSKYFAGSRLAHYRPLFNHHDSSNTSLSSEGSSSTSSYRAGYEIEQKLDEIWNGSPRSGRSKRPRDDGTIVFYSNAQFCTDLSGDRVIPVPLHPSGVEQNGFNDTRDVLGCRPNQLWPQVSRTTSGSILQYRPFRSASLTGAEVVSNTPELRVYSTGNSTEEGFTQLQKFEACGLGGTQPADHFAVRIKTRRILKPQSTKFSKFSAPSPRVKQFLHRISQSSLETFTDSRLRVDKDTSSTHLASLSASSPPEVGSNDLPTVRIEYLSATFARLEPSQLPEPTGYFGSSSNSDDEYFDTADTTPSSASPLHRTYLHKSFASITDLDTRRWTKDSLHFQPGTNDNDDNDVASGEDDEDEEDDMSIDMLGHMRETDPSIVAAKEKEFQMANDQIERLTDAGMATSAAATIAESDADT